MKTAGKCAAIALLTAFAAPAINAATYEVLDPPGSQFAYAIVIRDKVVTGTYFSTDNLTFGFIFSPTDGYTSFAIPGMPPDGSMQPMALDGAGNVYGFYYGADSGSRSFVRHVDGTVE